MNIKIILRNEFLNEWERQIIKNNKNPVKLRSLIPLTENTLSIIEAQFDIKGIRNKILTEQIINLDRNTDKLHEKHLRILAKKFAIKLFEVSNSGTDLDLSNIQMAKQFLLNESLCEIYPCKGK